MRKGKKGNGSGLKDWALLTSAFFNVLQLDKQAQTKSELESTRADRDYIKDKLKEFITASHQIKAENNSLRRMLEELRTELSQYKNKVYLMELEQKKLKEENAKLKSLK